MTTEAATQQSNSTRKRRRGCDGSGNSDSDGGGNSDSDGGGNSDSDGGGNSDSDGGSKTAAATATVTADRRWWRQLWQQRRIEDGGGR